MEIEISINKDTRKGFIDEIFLKHPKLGQLIIDDFYRYKTSGKLPSYFGRDVAFTEPYAAFKSGMMRIHLKFPPGKFPEKIPQYDRRCQFGDPINDACLVYVQGELYENRYSILAILNPDAHGKARNKEIMSYLSGIALKFKHHN